VRSFVMRNRRESPVGGAEGSVPGLPLCRVLFQFLSPRGHHVEDPFVVNGP
jgi:hypothetical protein